MTITYPLLFPETIGLVDSNLKIRSNVSMNQSPFSFAQQVYRWQGERWELEFSLPLMKRAVAEQYKSFLASLNGKLGTFLMYIPSSRENLGNYNDASKQLQCINGDHLQTISGLQIWTSIGEPHCLLGTAGQKNLKIGGVVASTNNILLAGDYFNIGTGASTRLYKILKNVNSDSNGEATLDIFPALRRDIVFSELIELQNPKVLLRLDSNVSEFKSDYNNLFSLYFSAIEAVNGT